MDDSLIFITVIFTIIIIIIIISAVKRNRNMNKFYSTQKQNLSKIGFSKNNLIEFSLAKLYIDTNLKIIVVDSFPNYLFINFKDIAKYEVILDNSIIKENAVGNAIIGGIIAGGVGAIIGSTSASSRELISQVAIHIYQISNPPLTFILNSTPISRVSNEYPLLLQKLDALSEILDSILNNKIIPV